jgi:hypothetical protein
MDSIFLIIVLFYGIDLLIVSVFIFDLTKRANVALSIKPVLNLSIASVRAPSQTGRIPFPPAARTEHRTQRRPCPAAARAWRQDADETCAALI